MGMVFGGENVFVWVGFIGFLNVFGMGKGDCVVVVGVFFGG